MPWSRYSKASLASVHILSFCSYQKLINFVKSLTKPSSWEAFKLLRCPARWGSFSFLLPSGGSRRIVWWYSTIKWSRNLSIFCNKTIIYSKYHTLKHLSNVEKLQYLSDFDMELFAIWRKGLRTAPFILATLATVGNLGNHLHAARLHLPENSKSFRFICTFQESPGVLSSWPDRGF